MALRKHTHVTHSTDKSKENEETEKKELGTIQKRREREKIELLTKSSQRDFLLILLFGEGKPCGTTVFILIELSKETKTPFCFFCCHF